MSDPIPRIPEAEPYPPRYWWLKRLCLAGVVVLALLLGIRLAWGWYADHKLAQTIAEMKSRGEPTTPEDLIAPYVPDADNAGILWNQALAAVAPGVDSPSNSSFDFPNYPPFTSQWRKLAEASEVANQQVISLSKQAAERSQVDWGIRYRSPMIASFPVGNLSGLRRMANTLGDAALLAQFDGSDIESLDRVRALLLLSRDVRRRFLLVDYLVGIGIEAIATTDLQMIAPALGPDRPTREKMTAMIELLGRLHDEDSSIRPMLGERVFMIDMQRGIQAQHWVMSPASNLVFLKSLDSWTPSSVFSPPSRTPVPNWQLPWSSIYGSPKRWGVVANRAKFERDVARISLAVRLFRLDNSRWPKTLDELVPEYLKSVPLDPFSPAPQAQIAYEIQRGVLPDGSDRPILFTVYDIERSTMTPAKVLEPRYGYGVLDERQERDLSVWIPPPKPSPATEESQAE